MSENQTKSNEKRHPIQVVARRSGLSQDVLRAWEKRYGVITPTRSPTGRRLYSDADVERLRLIQEAMTGGRRIGQLAKIKLEELEEMVQEDQRESISRPDTGAGQPDHSNPESYLAECLNAVRTLDDDRLKSSIGRAVIALRPDELIDDMVTPLMHRIGIMWAAGQLLPAHEHLASAVIRQTLAEIMTALQPQNDAPRVIVASPAHQHHEIAAMLVAVISALEGWQVTYLGSDLPAHDIARATDQTSASAIALSITHTAGDPLIGQELKVLRRLVPKTLPILIGGQAAPSYRDDIDTIGAIHIEYLEHLSRTLRDLKHNN